MVSIDPMLARRVLGCVAAVLVAVGIWPDAQAKRGGGGRPVPATTRDGQPNIQSDAAIVMDSTDGSILYAKNPDKIRAIASTGKIYIALLARRRGIDLEGVTEITEDDRKVTRGGAKTKLYTGHKFKNIDLLKAMLIASDNRAPAAIARAVGMTPAQFVDELNNLAIELGLTRTSFTDITGLRGNESTAREMAVALQAALEDDVLAEIMQTQQVTIYSVDDKPVAVNYGNTNRVLHGRYEVHGGKTGYTEAAGYCLVVNVTVGNRKLSCVFLGANGELTRYGDFSRVAAWIESQSSAEPTPGAAPPPPTPAAAQTP